MAYSSLRYQTQWVLNYILSTEMCSSLKVYQSQYLQAYDVNKCGMGLVETYFECSAELATDVLG